MDQKDGEVCICAGVILTLTLVGAVVGVPLIIVGVLITIFTEAPEEAIPSEPID